MHGEQAFISREIIGREILWRESPSHISSFWYSSIESLVDSSAADKNLTERMRNEFF